MFSYKKIAVIGLGLMGGSLALGLKRAGYSGTITGWSLSEAARQEALRLGAADEAADSPAEAAAGADLVVLAVPLGCYEDILKSISPCLKQGTVVTDVGSVKGSVVRLAGRLLPEGVPFVGGHPMAGSEKSGMKAAKASLYEKAYYFITPEKLISAELEAAVAGIREMAVLLGARPVILSADEHDRIVARISHLPQIAASTLAAMLDGDSCKGYLTYAAGGFKDTTRIASSNPQLWRDILQANKSEVIACLEEFEARCRELRTALEQDKPDMVLDSFETGKRVRDSIVKENSHADNK